MRRAHGGAMAGGSQGLPQAAMGSPGHSTKIAREKMPKLAMPVLKSRDMHAGHTHGVQSVPGSAPNARRPFRSGDGQAFMMSGEFDQPSTARSAGMLGIGGLGATKPNSGAHTERLAERDWRKPGLGKEDSLDAPFSRGSTGSHSVIAMERVRTVPRLSEFNNAEIARLSGTSLQKPAELDNWPSTNSASSNNWLRRLEHFLETRLAQATDKEARLLAFHECFAQFSELFKLYRPLLSKIHMAYDEYIANGQTASLKVSQAQAELFALQEHAQEEVRKSAICVTEQLADMKAAVANAEKERDQAVKELAAVKAELEGERKEVAEERAGNAAIREQARAFCSGYRWIIKNVLKQEEPHDMDALENVTLIQKLEKTTAQNDSQQKQLDYYASTAEIVYVQNILQEERKAYLADTERLSSEFSQLQNVEAECRKDLEKWQERCKALEANIQAVNDRLDKTYLPPLGDNERLPVFLRTEHPLVSRDVEKEEITDLLQTCMKRSIEAYDSGTYPDLESIFVDAVRDKWEKHTVAEWGRNVLQAIDNFPLDADCQLLGSMLATTMGTHMLIHRDKVNSECAAALTWLSKHLMEREGKGHERRDFVSAKDLSNDIRLAFPNKTEAQWQALVGLLSNVTFAGHDIDIHAIARGEPADVADVQLLRLLGRQLDEEVRQYAADLRAGLIEDSGKRKSKKSDVRVDYNDLRNRVQLMEPNKDDREVAAMVQRAFGIKSHEEAFRLCFDDVSDADMREPPPQPVEHILMRLDIAGLLRRTSPHTPAALDTSDGADSHLGVATMPPDTGKAPSPATRPVAAGGRLFQINEQEAPQDIVDKRNQAVETHLASIEAMQVPKWAAVKASTSGSKGQSDDGSEQEADQSFLSLLIARFANRAAAPPEAKIE